MAHTADAPWYTRPSLDWLLALIPVAIVLEFTHASAIAIFLVSGLAIVPLAGLMGRATENIAEAVGPGLGGLLNATFGNAAELIIALMFLWEGPGKYDYVKASLTGSIIGNVLLVLGAAILAGGLFHAEQKFNRTAASMGATLLALATVGLLVPSIFFFLYRSGEGKEATAGLTLLSEEIAVVLAVVYVLSLLFSLRTHKHLFAGDVEELPTTGEHHKPEWSVKFSTGVLLAATVGVAVMSEFLVGSVEKAAEAMGMNALFIGVFVVAIVGNAAEHSTAVMVAMKNKMDLAVNIAVGSSIQIALFVAPALVFASMAFGAIRGYAPLDLHFHELEVITVAASVAILALVAQDGESHWMEGVMLLAVYVILGLAFYHLPESALHAPTAAAVGQ
jgi:Ca2+:H+ antiporter